MKQPYIAPEIKKELKIFIFLLLLMEAISYLSNTDHLSTAEQQQHISVVYNEINQYIVDNKLAKQDDSYKLHYRSRDYYSVLRVIYYYSQPKEYVKNSLLDKFKTEKFNLGRESSRYKELKKDDITIAFEYGDASSFVLNFYCNLPK